jgi:hypothetical protein
LVNQREESTGLIGTRLSYDGLLSHDRVKAGQVVEGGVITGFKVASPVTGTDNVLGGQPVGESYAG